MNPGLIVNFYKPDKEKCGCTVVYRQRFKDLFKNSIISNSSEKPLLFLIHGVGGSGKIWRKQISYFIQKGYECVIPDLLGHG
jgi:pimeloyl-ACP methyl ester carboxylesterase